MLQITGYKYLAAQLYHSSNMKDHGVKVQLGVYENQNHPIDTIATASTLSIHNIYGIMGIESVYIHSLCICTHKVTKLQRFGIAVLYANTMPYILAQTAHHVGACIYAVQTNLL